jgi:hypothetical protein
MRKLLFIPLLAILSCTTPAAKSPQEAMEKFFGHLHKDEFDQAKYYALPPTFEHYQKLYSKVGYERTVRTYVSDTLLNENEAFVTYSIPKSYDTGNLDMYIHCVKKDGNWYAEERFKTQNIK